ncbi:MAG: hypothetical protein WCW68_00995 [Methanothrix sp.]|jgi:hypothetical protein
MHRTPSGDRRQALQKEARELARDARALQKAARAPAARQEAQRLQGEAEMALAEAGALKLQARLEDLTLWEMKKVKRSRNGSKTYSYWMASWREGGKTRNVHLGSARKMDGEAARRKAGEMKAGGWGRACDLHDLKTIFESNYAGNETSRSRRSE